MDDSYAQEVYVYEHLHQLKPEGFPFFPSVLGYGDIVSSSIFPTGHILIITFVEGEQLAGLWDQLDAAEKEHIRQECRKAVSVLRSLQVWLADSGKHNVLYSRTRKPSHSLTLKVSVNAQAKKPAIWMPRNSWPFSDELPGRNHLLVDSIKSKTRKPNNKPLAFLFELFHSFHFVFLSRRHIL